MHGGKLTESGLQEIALQLQQALIDADVPLDVATKFVDEIKQDAIGTKLAKSVHPNEQFVKIVYDRLVKLLSGGASQPESLSFAIPSVLMFVGLQGSGKTTTLGKIAFYLKEQARLKRKDRRILCASVDYYRPAAIDQLEILAQRASVDFYRAQATEPVAAVHEIMQHMRSGGYEHLLLDTAGRMHIDDAMLDELKKVDALAKPKYKILVLDAMTGQHSLEVAQAFNKAVGFDSAVLSKMDSETRAGAAVAFRAVLGKPIVAVGVGERLEDLQLFHPERVASRLIGMGDLQTLLERAEQKISAQEQQQATERLLAGDFNLEDFLTQLDMVSRVGSLGSLIQYMPGLGAGKLTPEQIEQGERDMRSFRAVISSMTPKERKMPRLIDESRKKRIARGAGVQVVQVNSLLERFEQSKQFVKLLKKNSLLNSLFRK